MKLCKLKCDRCGVEFEGKYYKEQIEIRFERTFKDGRLYLYDLSNSGVELDLCPGCRKGFKQWWNL